MVTKGTPPDRSGIESDEDLAELDEAWTLGPQLAQLFASSDQLDRDVSNQVDRRLRARSAMGDVTDLLGLGWSTMRILLIEDPPPADREAEGL
ncbi:MAG: hypothetical protein WBA45_09245 [Microthrixaceae bacterium]